MQLLHLSLHRVWTCRPSSLCLWGQPCKPPRSSSGESSWSRHRRTRPRVWNRWIDHVTKCRSDRNSRSSSFFANSWSPIFGFTPKSLVLCSLGPTLNLVLFLVTYLPSCFRLCNWTHHRCWHIGLRGHFLLWVVSLSLCSASCCTRWNELSHSHWCCLWLTSDRK